MKGDIFEKIETVVNEIHDTDESIEEYLKRGLETPLALSKRSDLLQAELRELQKIRSSVWDDKAAAEIGLWKAVLGLAFKDIFSRPKVKIVADATKAIEEIDKINMRLARNDVSKNQRARLRTLIRQQYREVKGFANCDFMTAFDFLMRESQDLILFKIGIDPEMMRETIRRKMTSASTINWRNARINYNNYIKLRDLEASL